MKKITPFLVVSLCSMVFVLGIALAGVLGENNKAVSTAENYFTAVKEKKYTESLEYFSPQTKNGSKHLKTPKISNFSWN